jgi:hypothetical protein
MGRGILAGVVIGAAVVIAAMGADRARSKRQAVLAPQRQAFLFSSTEIILLGGGNEKTSSDIARLDTTTGAIYRFRGNVDNSSVKNTWEFRVPPVKGPHVDPSPTCELQRELGSGGHLPLKPVRDSGAPSAPEDGPSEQGGGMAGNSSFAVGG